MDVQSPLLVTSSSSPPRESLDEPSWFPCGRWWQGGPQILTNAETVQRLMDMKITLAMTRTRAMEDYQEKAREVAHLVRQGLKRQAYESMRTAKQYKQDWETRHAMYETVERIKSRLVAQQHNMALFSSFVEANDALAQMLKDVPLEKVEQVLDDINERMLETHEVSATLASPGTEAAASVDEDELALFLAQTPLSEAVMPDMMMTAAAATPMVKTRSPASRLVME